MKTINPAELNEIIKDLLEEHKGGSKFFDNLDNTIRSTDSILGSLIALIDDPFDGIIVSGKFGRVFSNIVPWSVISVNGSLRKNEPMDDLSYMDLSGKKFIFVDDSFYSGKTRNVIQSELNKLGAQIISTYVVYDGSIERDVTVQSLYRYHA